MCGDPCRPVLEARQSSGDHWSGASKLREGTRNGGKGIIKYNQQIDTEQAGY